MCADPNQGEEAQRECQPVPYDENLVERARTQWPFGDGAPTCL